MGNLLQVAVEGQASKHDCECASFPDLSMCKVLLFVPSIQLYHRHFSLGQFSSAQAFMFLFLYHFWMIFI